MLSRKKGESTELSHQRTWNNTGGNGGSVSYEHTTNALSSFIQLSLVYPFGRFISSPMFIFTDIEKYCIIFHSDMYFVRLCRGIFSMTFTRAYNSSLFLIHFFSCELPIDFIYYIFYEFFSFAYRVATVAHTLQINK